MNKCKPITITLAGDSTDTVLSGAGVYVYGYSLVSADADLQFYDGLAAYTAGTTIAFYHRSGDASKTVSFACGVALPNGLYVEGTGGGVITLLVEKI